MIPLTELLQQSAAHTWLFIPAAIMLGALHGLEPGHSKTMMAAFIIAIHGTVRQAVLLGIAATVSHTTIVWIVALGGMWLFGGLNAEATEPYFQCVSGLLIVSIAAWMLWRTWREQRTHDHDNHHHHHSDSPDELNVINDGYADAHERSHGENIRRRFKHRHVTTWHIVMFGLTGGLLPCPGAITVLLLCLQSNRLVLGAALVVSFSIGLAITMVASGIIAALSVRHMSKHWSGFGEVVRKAPYVSGIMILMIGTYVALHGWTAIPH
ncbi:MAG TPA: nickel/cobalt efflux transporter [Xylella taiwanensis]